MKEKEKEEEEDMKETRAPSAFSILYFVFNFILWKYYNVLNGKFSKRQQKTTTIQGWNFVCYTK